MNRGRSSRANLEAYRTTAIASYQFTTKDKMLARCSVELSRVVQVPCFKTFSFLSVKSANTWLSSVGKRNTSLHLVPRMEKVQNASHKTNLSLCEGRRAQKGVAHEPL